MYGRFCVFSCVFISSMCYFIVWGDFLRFFEFRFGKFYRLVLFFIFRFVEGLRLVGEFFIYFFKRKWDFWEFFRMGGRG